MVVATEDSVESQRKNGYLLPDEKLFDDETFGRLKEIFERLNRDGKELDCPHFNYPELLEFILSEHVLKHVRPLLGPNVGLFASHFICKEPFLGKATPWHEDSAYWKGRFDRWDAIVTIWLALDDVDEVNGAMKVIPGTHLVEGAEYEDVDVETNIFREQIVKIDDGKAVTFCREAGQFSMHDSRIYHGADANTSSRRRCGYTMRYFSQDMKYVTDFKGNSNHKLWHCCGENPHGNPSVNS